MGSRTFDWKTAVAGVLAAAVVPFAMVVATPASKLLDERWRSHNEASATQVDHLGGGSTR